MIGEERFEHERKFIAANDPYSPTRIAMDWAHTEIEKLRGKLVTVAKHPDTPEIIKQYALGKLDGH